MNNTEALAQIGKWVEHGIKDKGENSKQWYLVKITELLNEIGVVDIDLKDINKGYHSYFNPFIKATDYKDRYIKGSFEK